MAKNRTGNHVFRLWPAIKLIAIGTSYTVLTHDGELLPVSFEKQAVAPKGKRVIKASTAKKSARVDGFRY